MVWHIQTVVNWRHPKLLLSRLIIFLTDIAWSSEAETLVSEEAEYSIFIREDKKGELFGVTLFN